jgi:hypothetical protein
MAVIPDQLVSRCGVHGELYGFNDESECLPGIDRPPAIPFGVVSEFTVTATGVEFRERHRVIAQLEQGIQRPAGNHITSVIQLQSHDLK